MNQGEGDGDEVAQLCPTLCNLVTEQQKEEDKSHYEIDDQGFLGSLVV